ncbi:unnamed protein product, partial [Medioppia subpectinata]
MATANKSEGNYETQFIEMSAIGSGGFGTVYKVKHRLDDKIYAIKIVQFRDFTEEKKETVLKEVKYLTELDSEYVVKYYNSWLESNHLFIQMEFCSQSLKSVLKDKPIFCSQSLKSVLKDKPIVFERQPEEVINNVFDSESFYAKESMFKTSILCLYQTLVAMMSTPNWRQRPDCRKVLAKQEDWSIDKYLWLCVDTRTCTVNNIVVLKVRSHLGGRVSAKANFYERRGEGVMDFKN